MKRSSFLRSLAAIVIAPATVLKIAKDIKPKEEVGETFYFSSIDNFYVGDIVTDSEKHLFRVEYDHNQKKVLRMITNIPNKPFPYPAKGQLNKVCSTFFEMSEVSPKIN